MFTGIIQSTGRIVRIEPRGGDARLVLVAPDIGPSDVALGDSISVSGCCLTVISIDGDTLAFDVSNETLSLTTLGDLCPGDRVNLEKALRLSDRLGGHLVFGHVDGVGSIVAVEPDARSQRWTIEAPPALTRYIAAKGSVCVDGVSLTVNEIAGDRFGVNLIPHTVAITTFADRRAGDRVNLEVDMLARYVERLSQASPLPGPPPHAGEGDERAARVGGGNDGPPHAGEGDERAARVGGGGMSFASIPELLEDVAAGRMVVMLDDEDRENEGDLIMAANRVRAEDVNFMAREGRGLICLALDQARGRRLDLQPMVRDNASAYHTNFTVSIEAASGVTTGISAHDRARTIRVAVASDAKPSDLVQPGHVFPLLAQPGGVLTRAGHTEAAVDLAALAGCEPAGVLVEILREDGSMARRPDLEAFAAKHGLKIGTIADLIRHRLATEKTIERVHESDVETEFGAFRLVAWRDRLHGDLHFALARGAIDDGAPVLARVHVRNTLSDVLHLRREDLGLTMTAALRRIAGEGRGVVVVLAADEESGTLLARLNHENAPPVAGRNAAAQREWRQLGLGAQILADLGVRRLRVLGTPRKLVGLSGFDLEVVEYVDAPATARGQ